jgi:hypothetical protein
VLSHSSHSSDEGLRRPGERGHSSFDLAPCPPPGEPVRRTDGSRTIRPPEPGRPHQMVAICDAKLVW